MYVDDGAWSSKLALRDKAQATAQDFIALIKNASIDTDLPESVARLSHILEQVQDANFGLLDNLRATDHARESLRIEPPPMRE
ncbi:hypothetical protein EC968_009208 [Mortierella alpina]|nr:hypothetical protein EC968_009208 [Mortierella alpina]